MAVRKDNNNKWISTVWYKDYNGESRRKKKEGFKLKREAEEWERDFLSKQAAQPDMTFDTLCDLYLETQKAHRKYSTYTTKQHRIDAWIRPAFKNRCISDIEAKDILKWQTELKTAEGQRGKPLSPGYMNSLFRELSSIFIFACKYYNLRENPTRKAGNMVGHKTKSMLFWTRDEFQKFIDTFDPADPFYAFFMVMYYTGMRRGECLALTVSDIADGRISINKTYNMYDGQETITTPKTAHSVRDITIPASLQEVIEKHIKRIYGAQPDTRIFSMISRSAAAYQLNNHAELAGVQRIRIHDLRHSHASLLIDMGFSAILVSQRLGHDNVNTTLTVYAHLFPDRQNEVADKLEEIMNRSEIVPKNVQEIKKEQFSDENSDLNHKI